MLYKRGFIHLFILLIPIILISLGVIGYSIFEMNKANFKKNGTSPTSVLSIKPINEGDIAYIEKDRVYIYNTSEMKSHELQLDELTDKTNKEHVGNLSFSPNGRYLYLTCGEQKLCIYDFSTNKQKVVDTSWLNPHIDSFSPDQNYAIVDMGCCPGNREKMLITPQGDVLEEFVATEILWSKSENKFALTIGDVVIVDSDTPTWSLFIANVKDNKLDKSLILKADYQTSNHVVEWSDQDNLLVKQYIYSKPLPPGSFDINDPKLLEVLYSPKETYKTVDINTRKTTPSDYTQPTPILGKVYKKESFSPSRKWKVFFENISDENEKYLRSDIYLSSSDETQKIKIGEGNEFAWKPGVN